MKEQRRAQAEHNGDESECDKVFHDWNYRVNTNRRLVWVTLAAALACLATASLGFWQLGRAEEKLARQASLDQRALEPVLLAGQLDASAVAPELSYQSHRGAWTLAERAHHLSRQSSDEQPGRLLCGDATATAGKR